MDHQFLAFIFYILIFLDSEQVRVPNVIALVGLPVSTLINN
jgi:hypothetical protein